MKETTYTTADAIEFLADEMPISFFGRVIAFRNLGSIAFGKLVDQSGPIQFCLNKKITPETFKDWVSQVKMGDIVYIDGKMWTSSTGERTVLVDRNFEIKQHSLTPWPNKWTGIVDPETKLRKRYLDVALDPEVKNVFLMRSKIISTIRDFLHMRDFIELETPILQVQASGAQAKPFSTHHSAYDTDLFLRIAPETYLKRALVASFDRVFEIGKNFRNEGLSPQHLQEFTSVEWYVAHWNYMDNLEFFRLLMQMVLQRTNHYIDGQYVGNHYIYGRYVVQYQGIELDFTDALTENNITSIRKFEDVFMEYTGLSPFDVPAKEIDVLFKTKVRPNLIQPIFIIDYPSHMSPLAKRSADGRTVEQFQFIVNGMELVKAYSELTDPVLQRRLLEEQLILKNAGDEETVDLEEDYIECMEYGMPENSGLGLGLDRLIMLLTNQTTLRNVVLFPTVL